MKIRIVTSIQCDKITSKFNKFSDHDLNFYIDKFECFDRFEKELDKFNSSKVGVKHFKEFSVFVKLVLTLSHGQASVETIKSSKKGPLLQKTLKDHMTANDLKPDSVLIIIKLLLSVASARQKYKDSLEKKERRKKVNK